MRIGITGCAGFIGSHLVDSLLYKKYDVSGIDNLTMGSIENLSNSLNDSRFKFYKVDVRDLKPMRKLLSKVDVIVHLAAYKIPRYGNALETLLINNNGTQNILEIAKKNKIKVVFASTSDVYGKNSKLPFSEESDLVFGTSTVTRWSYAVSKLFDELLSFAYQDEYDVPVVNLRFFGCYGPRHHLSWWGGPQSVFISQFLNGQEITIHGDGKQIRTFTYISDTIEGIVASIEKDEANGHNFNIGSDNSLSIIDLAKLIGKLCAEICGNDFDIKLKYVPYSSFSKNKYEDVRCRVPDNTKAKKILKIIPKISLEDGLKITIRWQKQILKK